MQPTVITAEELAAQLDGKTPPLVAQVTTAEAYHAGHVPGAVHVEPSDLVSGIPPASGRLPSVARLTAVFRGMGYDHDRTVVTLDDEGGGWAGRLAWTLDIIGNSHWRYLDGGLRAWHAAGLPLTREPTPVVPTTVDITVDTGPVAEAEDILEHLDDPELVIWDCRSRAEFDGRRRAAKRVGHIPGAVNLDWLDLMDRDRDLRLIDDPRALLARHGVLAERDVITHCQTHHRSGLTYLVARLLGFPRIRAYHGSWSEWGNREDTPVE